MFQIKSLVKVLDDLMAILHAFTDDPTPENQKQVLEKLRLFQDLASDVFQVFGTRKNDPGPGHPGYPKGVRQDGTAVELEDKA